jgi:hypothetical protein
MARVIAGHEALAVNEISDHKYFCACQLATGEY